MQPSRKTLPAFVLLVILAACQATNPTGLVPAPTRPQLATNTPFQPIPPTPTVATPIPPTATPNPPLKVWIDASVPPGLRSALALPQGSLAVKQAADADVRLGPAANSQETAVRWIYALVAPFPTLADGVSLQELQNAWGGKSSGPFEGRPLLVSPSTAAAFSLRWGPPAGEAVQVTSDAGLADEAWNNRPSWAIVPFEQVEPRWKVLRVDGNSPMDKDFPAADYPLALSFSLEGTPAALQNLATFAHSNAGSLLPSTNRDPSRLTTVVMTGVTALVRATADRMETRGLTYPGRDIVDWLKSADITHISNEIAFNPECPRPNASDPRLVFCSDPRYIALLDFIGADVIDMTGNHLNDYGPDWVGYTLDIYRQHNMKFYAAGLTLDEARQPVLMENNGNRFAFLGCNKGGPAHDWATDKRPGTATCDLDWMESEVRSLVKQGYLPIVTFQYYESYAPKPNPDQVTDFRRMSDAGAVVVSGSQAHRPQTKEIRNGRFIDYGLGNLFFDQMETPYTGTRQEFIDRYTFYNGRLLGVELLTAMLEDYARPRPMTPAERNDLLSEIFKVSGW